MNEVTDADRDKALDIIGEHGHGDPDPFGEIAEAIAAALAEEREKARAPFRDLVHWLETTEDGFRDDPNYIADIIRLALAEVTE